MRKLLNTVVIGVLLAVPVNLTSYAREAACGKPTAEFVGNAEGIMQLRYNDTTFEQKYRDVQMQAMRAHVQAPSREEVKRMIEAQFKTKMDQLFPAGIPADQNQRFSIDINCTYPPLRCKITITID